MAHLSARAISAEAEIVAMVRFLEQVMARSEARPDIADFTFGNPHEMPLPGLVAALRKPASSRRTRTGSPTRRARPSRGRSSPTRSGRELGLAFEPEDMR